MTLAQLDALISAKPGAVAIVLGEPEWHELMTNPAAAPRRSTLDNGQAVYRGLTTWVAFPSRLAVLDRAEAEAEGIPIA